MMLPEGIFVQAVLRLLLLVVAVLLWWRIDGLVNLSTSRTPKILRFLIVSQYVSLSAVMVWLIGILSLN